MIRRCSYHNLPLPLVKGKGTKGIGLPNKSLKEVRSISHFGYKTLGSAIIKGTTLYLRDFHALIFA